MKKYNLIFVMILIAFILSNVIFNIITSFAGGVDAKWQYIEIELENYNNNNSKITTYRNGEEVKYIEVDSVEDVNINNAYIQLDNTIKFYYMYNAFYETYGRDYINTVKVEITNNNGEITEHIFEFVYDESKYYFHKYDCETGILSEKTAIEENIPRIEEEKNMLMWNTTIVVVRFVINIVFVIYLIFYVFKFIKNKKTSESL